MFDNFLLITGSIILGAVLLLGTYVLISQRRFSRWLLRQTNRISAAFTHAEKTMSEMEDETRPIETEFCSEAEARRKLEEFFTHYEKGGGSGLRVELVRGLPGIRFTLVGSWEDMS